MTAVINLVLWMTFRQKLNKQNKLNLLNNKIKVLNRKKSGVRTNKLTIFIICTRSFKSCFGFYVSKSDCCRLIQVLTFI